MALAALTGWTGTANAGPPPPVVSVATDCDGETGLVVVTIADFADFYYDVSIDDVPVASNVTVNLEADLVYEVPDGNYLVEVDWIQGETTIFSDTVTLACAPVETPTTTTTTTLPPQPATEAVVAEPDFTG